jgi:RNA polymerase sigma factor (sigma-70 family)
VSTNESTSLIDRLRCGEPAALEQVYAEEKAGLYGFLLRLSGDPHCAADLFQNVWLKLARHATALRPDSNVRAWLYTVARREYLSFRRAQALDLSRLLVLGLEPRQAPADLTPDTDLAALKAGFDRLGEADREVLLLSFAEGLDTRAAAEILGIGAVALRQRLARARRRLAQLLEEAEVNGPGLTRGTR